MIEMEKHINMGYYWYNCNGEKVFIHREVAEQHIGRKLKKNEVAHHLDGNKLNNDPENIVVLTRVDHARIHKNPNIKLKKTKDGLFEACPFSKKCVICGIEFEDFSEVTICCNNCLKNKKQETTKVQNTNTYGRLCKVCGSTLHKREITYCSQECFHIDCYVCEHPSKEQLEKMVWAMPATKISEIYGVSDKSIDNWCKKYRIKKPGRGYWAKIRSKN